MLKITLVALGNKMPAWVNQGVQEFAKRLQDGVALTIVEIPLLRRGKSADLVRIMEKEAREVLSAIPHGSCVIALDVNGESFTSEQLATKLERLQQTNSHLCFIIGGPEGLNAQILTNSHQRWSLSKLTMPHPIVRIVLLESLYRAWSILHNHPYHKA